MGVWKSEITLFYPQLESTNSSFTNIIQNGTHYFHCKIYFKQSRIIRGTLRLFSKLLNCLACKNNNKKKEYLFSFGSMVQNGKFSAAAELFVRTLKNVDFPTLGTPTIPTLRLVPTRPIRGFFSGSCAFLGGILSETKEKPF